MTLNTTHRTRRPAPEQKLYQDQFIGIWGFMLTDLKLAKTELLVYAVIFSMYKHRNDYFCGSREYLQAWCNAGKSAVESALLSLEKKNLIVKEYRRFGKATKAIYIINTESLPTCEMFENENRNRDINEMIRKEEKKRRLGVY